MHRAGLTVLALVVPALTLAAVDKHAKHKSWTDKYDRYFRKYSKHYFGPHVDWHWFKAQAIAESTLKPKARSKTGARGLMQILPSTFREIKKSNPHLVNVDEPGWNIAAGIYYDRYLYRRWDKGFPFHERLAFTFGSYNAGFGGVNKAYKKAENKHPEIKAWDQVAPYAPRQTRSYVKRIRKLMKR
ncbi:MAG: transglycosylase SLT domain-containing protein [Pseudomonadota bacterium]